MKRIKNTFSKSFFKASVIVALLLLCVGPISVTQTSATSQSELDSLQQQLNDVNKKIATKKNESKTLSGEVASFDGQIQTIETQIQATQNEITSITSQIDSLNKQIGDTEVNLKTQKDTLNEYLRVIYEESNTSTLELVAGSDSFSDFVDKTEYLQTMQIKVKDMVEKIKRLKEELEKNKKDLSKKNDNLHSLKSQQISQKSDLDTQRASRQTLLDKTNGEEANFQALAKTISAEYESMQSALWATTGNYVSLGHVNRGDIIGYQGNSGFSSGSHLHFEIRNSSQQHVNPGSYIGDGYFITPISGAAITQGYGPTSWWAYSFHTGIDYSAGSGTPIVATAEGDIVQRVGGQPNTYPGGPMIYGNYVKIKHTNGMFSLYGHLQ